MKSKTTSIKQIHFLRLMKGEDLLESIMAYCYKNEISSGSVQGIGAIQNPSIGYFDLKKKEYFTNTYNFNAELVNCSGNVSKNKETGEIIIHLHMVVGDPKGQAFGGHVMSNNIISVTGEFVILETEGTNYRVVDEDFKLMLLDL